ncbi:hypothetical protein [Microbacterium sp. VKM Ac-2923]|uniref:hypothetical protein n=1 Tax=Microbacterium sp. VKM Ac-2923 TaxID=2929476 RepID=UPI001FB3988A|nr:hypothetical protein [Microbacterium sp. VKM Ac-2923]MCJ1707587.1 hypothetical protein [Microbacterium sp. VKM Ac-2923]
MPSASRAPAARPSADRATTIRLLRTASLVVAGVGASITMGALGSWWTPVILLVATAGAVLVVWRGGVTPVGERVVAPALAVVVALTAAALFGLAGVLPSGWTWASLGAYGVAWGEYLFTQTLARSRAAGSAR